MRATVNFDDKTITAGIRDLVEPIRYSARGVGMLPLLRAELGQEVHKRYRQQRERTVAGFQAEVTVSMTRVCDGFTAHIRGRVDGLFTNPANEDSDSGRDRHRARQILVEEVKSMALSGRELEQLTPDAVSDYNMQARLYALCCVEQYPQDDVAARLHLVSILDGATRTMDVEFSRAGAAYALDRLLRRAIREAEEARARAQKRARCAQKLSFPYPALRPNQAQLIEDIAAGLDGNRPVLAWAPTGIGKTVSALMPALKYALERSCGLYFATAKTTQQALVAETFQDIADASELTGTDISAITLRAKDRMCPPGDLLCHPDVCSYLREFTARVQACDAVAALTADTVHVTPDRVYEYGQRTQLCPFELSLRVAARAELVIADYNYVYDGAIALGPFSDDSQANSAVVIADEGHNLLDRARGYHSSFIGKARIAHVRSRIRSGAYLSERDRARVRARRDTRTRPAQLCMLDESGLTPSANRNPHTSRASGPALLTDLDDLFERLTRHIDIALATAHEQHRGFVADCTPIDPDMDGWRALAESAVSGLLAFALYCRANKLVFPRDPLIDLLRDVVHMRNGVLCAEPELVPYVAGPRSDCGTGLGVMCVNPARRLSRRHMRVLGTILMSATLTPLPFYADVLGFGAMDPVLSTVGCPFPRYNRAVVIVPTVDTTYRRRDRHVTDIAHLIEDIVSTRPGRYIAYFSSFAFLTRVRAALQPRDAEILVQLPGMTRAAQDATLTRLKHSAGTALLLAVTGGVFAEGVDLPGDQLIGAIVVGPCLPPVGFERRLMQAYYAERGDDGFAYTMLYPGMQRVIQSAGRVIRTMSDKGVIALVGRRFAESDYARFLPPDWYSSGVKELITTEPAYRLEAFWRATTTNDHDERPRLI